MRLTRESYEKGVSKQVEALPLMSKGQLQNLWTEVVKTPLPRQLRKGLLVSILAYQIQEQAYGGLRQSTWIRLLKLASALENDNPHKPRLAAVAPGTRLIREWNQHSHVVEVEENGYRYEDELYGSLSEIARRITGTRWSGPLFFGLKSTVEKGGSVHER